MAKTPVRSLRTPRVDRYARTVHPHRSGPTQGIARSPRAIQLYDAHTLVLPGKSSRSSAVTVSGEQRTHALRPATPSNPSVRRTLVRGTPPFTIRLNSAANAALDEFEPSSSDTVRTHRTYP
jgi:hypothetical protein